MLRNIPLIPKGDSDRHRTGAAQINLGPGGDSFGLNGLPVVTQYGKILNDTTFVLTKHEKYGKTSEINHFYSFHEFSPKPESMYCEAQKEKT